MAGAFFALAVLAGSALMFWHLHPLWNPDGAYAYGWAVPLLVLFLCRSRWEDRPPASTPLRGAVFLAIVFAMVLLPARWLQEAAPERSICEWTYAVACVGISLCLVSLAGGGPWLRWFLFPFAFALIAVPWPHSLEMIVSNSLMHRTAGVTVETLCLIGVPSAQAGNLVHIETGVIDIDEACSGIRSLQAMVMITLFLGELFRLATARRLLLIILGVAVTLAANVIRTVMLSRIAFGQGMNAVDHYHDAAGYAVLAFSLSCTLAIAFLLRPAKAAPASASGEVTVLPSLKLCLALLAWFNVVEVAVEGWYRAHESRWQGWSWNVDWPQHAKDFRPIEIPRNSLRILMCDESRAATWKEPDGTGWSLYLIRWNPGNAAAESAKVHRPDVCLNAEGAIMESDMGARLGSVDGMQMPFHSYAFRLGDKTLYVFFCLYEEIPGARPGAADVKFEGVDMLSRALQGRRHIGLQSVELALSGYDSELAAQKAFETRLAQLIKPREGAVPVRGK